MKKTTLIALALLATSSLALAQGSGSGSGSSGGTSSGAAGTAGAAPGGVPSGTGGIGTAPGGGAGVPGGTGPGDLTVRPNIPEMRPGNAPVGRDATNDLRTTTPSGSGLSSRPSSLEGRNSSLGSTGPAAGTNSTPGRSDPTAPPPGAPRIMVPERR